MKGLLEEKEPPGASNDDGFFTRSREELTMYTIFQRPADYPEHFVIRRNDVGKTIKLLPALRLTKTLKEARELLLPYELNCMARSEEDPPSLMETWF